MENEKIIRVAHIIGKWIGGGVEAVVMNYYRNIDRSKIQFDFFCDEDSTDIPFNEIQALGGKVILIPPYQNIFKYNKILKIELEKGEYKIIHSHINALSVFPLRIAKKSGIQIRIAHSHSTTNNIEWKKNIIKSLLKPFSKIYATDFFACTEHAGKWLFGKSAYKKNIIFILNNAIDIKNYKFDSEKRKQFRERNNINSDTFVIGHAGRFVTQKNHEFLIDIFDKLYKKNKNSLLILVGQGPLQGKIKEKINNLKLEDKVLFLNQRNDLNELYSAFDLFLFPSLYEGLGMVIIEAQTSGCPCLVSTEVPRDVKLTDLVKFEDLNSNVDIWSYDIMSLKKDSDREKYEKIMSKTQYNIITEAKKLENKYIELEEKNEKSSDFNLVK